MLLVKDNKIQWIISIWPLKTMIEICVLIIYEFSLYKKMIYIFFY